MKTKVGVFFGGHSVEHEVSIITALQAIENMDTEKYDIIPIYIAKDNKMYCGEDIGDIKKYKDIDALIKNSTQVTLAQKDDKAVLLKINKKPFEKDIYDYIDIAFPIVHGTNVEDGTIEGYLKMFNIPYCESDLTSSAMGMDKYFFKCILKQNNIPSIDGICVFSDEYNEDEDAIKNRIEKEVGYPVIVKPANSGSSVGISAAKDRKELANSLDEAFNYARKVVVEKAIMNLKEINCSVCGDYEEARASECEEPIKSDEILSYKDKYMGEAKTKGSKRSMNAGSLKLPADISKEKKEEIQSLALRTFKLLGCSGVCRIDFIIDQDNNDKVYVNEINTIPGSLSFHLWKAAGVNYKDLLNKIIDLALKRKREDDDTTFSFTTNILAGYTSGGLKGGLKK